MNPNNECMLGFGVATDNRTPEMMAAIRGLRQQAAAERWSFETYDQRCRDICAGHAQSFAQSFPVSSVCKAEMASRQTNKPSMNSSS